MTFLREPKSLFTSRPSQQERDEAYLGKSVDIYDLERRMRHLDDRDSGRSSSMIPGLSHSRSF